jgi:hypothetical protein
MGFNKRIITQELIISTDDSNLPNLFKADSLIFDNWSYKFYELYSNGTNKQIAIELLLSKN